jgi:hypothetical protein
VTKDGKVKLEDIAKIYDVSRHPEIISGKKSAEEVFVEFMAQWDTQSRDGTVTFEEFCDYYSDVSASIEDDDCCLCPDCKLAREIVGGDP